MMRMTNKTLLTASCSLLRSKEQLDQEEKMRQRLKQVYKHAKAQQKRKEK
jgi:hypothetical protein